ncbi:MAG: hypothetical protein AB7P02_14850 [Alphaproteobacteria bacterium]
MADLNGGNGRRGLRFDPTINAGHLFMAASTILAVLVAYYDLKGRVDGHDRRFVEVDRRIEATEVRQREIMAEIREALRRLETRQEENARVDSQTRERIGRMEGQIGALTESVRQSLAQRRVPPPHAPFTGGDVPQFRSE